MMVPWLNLMLKVALLPDEKCISVAHLSLGREEGKVVATCSDSALGHVELGIVCTFMLIITLTRQIYLMKTALMGHTCQWEGRRG